MPITLADSEIFHPKFQQICVHNFICMYWLRNGHASRISWVICSNITLFIAQLVTDNEKKLWEVMGSTSLLHVKINGNDAIIK